jgi:hypothetical protein
LVTPFSTSEQRKEFLAGALRLHLTQATALDLINKSADAVTVRKIGTGSDALNSAAHGRVDVVEGSELECRLSSRFGGDLRAKRGFVHAVQSAVGMMHQNYFARLQQPLG